MEIFTQILGKTPGAHGPPLTPENHFPSLVYPHGHPVMEERKETQFFYFVYFCFLLLFILFSLLFFNLLLCFINRRVLLSLTSPALAGGFFNSSATWEAHSSNRFTDVPEVTQPAGGQRGVAVRGREERCLACRASDP